MEVSGSIFVEDGQIEHVENLHQDKKNEIIYEVLRVVNRKPLFLEQHIRRMEKSFNVINKTFYYEECKIREFIETLINSNNVDNGNIKITIDTGLDTIKLFFIPHSYPTEEMYSNGIKTILYKGERENPNAKIIQTEFREKVNYEIKNKNVYEALLVDRNDEITEGSRSNIFVIKDNIVITPPVEKVLPGVTRGEIIKLCEELGFEVVEEVITVRGLPFISTAFLSGTSPKILPISTIDEISLDVNNEVLRKLMKEFDIRINKYLLK